MRSRLSRAVTAGLGAPRARRLAAPLGALGVVALAIGVVVGAGLPASSKGAASAAKSAGAATVQRRDLVATDTESGTLGYARPQTVYNRLSGTITWLPSVGQVIKPGGTLYRVDNSPVVLFDGTTPAYRTLSSGVSDGPDIQELNQNLAQLGFDASHQIAVDQTWQAATTTAVERWQAALGQTQTGTVTLGQIVFLPGSQLVTTLATVLGSTGGSGSGSSGSGSSGSGTGSGSTGASLTPTAPPAQFVSLTTTTSTTPTSTSTTPTTTTTTPTTPSRTTPSPTKKKPGGSSSAQLKALIALLKAEIAELRKSAAPAGSSSRAGASSSGAGAGSSGAGASSASGGSTGSGAASGSSGAASAQATLQTTSTQEVVTVQLDATKQTEAVAGETVAVQLPDGSTVKGKITQVSPVAQSSSSSSGSGGGSAGGSGSSGTPTATIPVTITLIGHTHLSGLDQAAVSVNFAQQRARGVLSVPVTALIATQGGGYAVQRAAAPHGLIPVTPGLFAAGYVQISGTGIYPGLQVTDSQG